MCFTLATPNKERIKKIVGEHVSIDDYTQSKKVSGFEHPNLPVMLCEKPSHVQAIRWGLVPSWATNEQAAKDIATKTLNAKAETLFQLPSFKFSAQHHRCLIFVDGFYEWQHQGKLKVPYYIQATQDAPLVMGGVYSYWKGMNGAAMLLSCSIITTPANALMEQIHNTKKRMPLLLNASDWDTWLAPTTSEKSIQQLMRPLEEGYLQANKAIDDGVLSLF